MVTLGAVLALYSALTTAWLGSDIRRLPPSVINGDALQIGPVRVTEAQLLILGAVALLIAALVWLLRGTKLGLAIRAMADRPDAAELMGIDTARAAAIVSFLSGCLGGAGGVLIGLQRNAIDTYMGEEMMLRGFVVDHRGRPGRRPRRRGRRIAARADRGADRRLRRFQPEGGGGFPAAGGGAVDAAVRAVRPRRGA